MTSFSVKPLDETTWPDFARLVERHNGVWGGCWCMAFHAEGVGRAKTAAQNRSEKECRVREGRAQAAETPGYLNFDIEMNAEYTITSDPRRLDLVASHAFLSNTYWSPGVPMAVVSKAHGLYAQFGFKALANPSRMMEKWNPAVYQPLHQGTP